MLFICVKIILVHLNRTKMHDDPSCIHLEKNYLRLCTLGNHSFLF